MSAKRIQGKLYQMLVVYGPGGGNPQASLDLLQFQTKYISKQRVLCEFS